MDEAELMKSMLAFMCAEIAGSLELHMHSLWGSQYIVNCVIHPVLASASITNPIVTHHLRIRVQQLLSLAVR